MISQQPPEAEDRTIPSHREGDLIIDKDSTSAIGTPVKRATQFVILPHPPSRHSAEEAHDAMTSTIQDPPRALHGAPRPETKASQRPPTPKSPWPPNCRPTSATPTHPDNTAPAKTPTDYYTNTSPKAPTRPYTTPHT
jgi:hypothetical protein